MSKYQVLQPSFTSAPAKAYVAKSASLCHFQHVISQCLFMCYRHKNHVFIFSSNTQTSVQQGQIQHSIINQLKNLWRELPGKKPRGVHSPRSKTLGMILAGKILRSERHKSQMDRQRFLKPGCSFQKRAANHSHFAKNS